MRERSVAVSETKGRSSKMKRIVIVGAGQLERVSDTLHSCVAQRAAGMTFQWNAT